MVAKMMAIVDCLIDPYYWQIKLDASRKNKTSCSARS